MNLTVRILGCEVLAIDTTAAASSTDGGDVTTVAIGVGFTNIWQGHTEEDR